ncbi:lipoamide acyltransferase component of branched-chain alpha-keto acid dehydrogenase complex, mitochondrial [Cyclospora cayetanensis]|nr:lipoamide acyltransferase component of branched-chain alpha-keto acid dehydrogenase complex, mitochondrial [Cyclospora cayetanensis]
MASLARYVGRLAVSGCSSGGVSSSNWIYSAAAAGAVSVQKNASTVQPLSRGFFTLSRPRQGIVRFNLADIGEGIAHVELTKWYKAEGDDVEEMDEVCEVQSDKAAVEITSRYTGKIVKLYAKEGDTVKIGGPLMDIDSPDVESDSSSSSPEEPVSEEVQSEKVQPRVETRSSSEGAQALVSPAVRRLAKENRIDLENIKGSGPRGTITKDDVLKYISSSSTSFTPSSPTRSSSSTSSGGSTQGSREVELQGFSKAMVKSMNESLKVPHMNIGDEYDVTRLTAVREVLNKKLAAEQNVKVSLTAFLIKAMSIAIHEYPIVNSKFNTTTQSSYTEFESHNVSVAIDSPSGLVVPCVKNVQDLTLVEIQEELIRLQGLAKANRLSPADLTGGTISLSNVGVISGTYIHPLLFDGQAVIVGVGRVQRLPRLVERESSEGFETSLEGRDIINCSFSADHRHCDGATITKFSKSIKNLLENPELMLAYLK